jgi:23S rRNA pseudouridine2605 synthase
MTTTKAAEERLQKILSRAGIASRRTAERLIQTGRVKVNGTIVTELGTKASPSRDRITVDGQPVHLAQDHVYLLLHKPVGVVTTMSDPQGRPSIGAMIAGLRPRVYPVGRLDFHSAGLLLLTNDGELALRLSIRATVCARPIG